MNSLVNKYLLLLTLGVGLAFSAQTCAQDVRNSTYELMLDNLLSHTVEEVSAEEVAEMKDVTLLDSREAREFEVSHIENATCVGYDEFDPSLVEDLPRDQKIVVYCSVGYRSEKITEKLLAMGFTDVANMYGGIFEWVNSGLPVVDENGDPTKAIHAYDRVWGVWLEEGEKVYK